MTAEKLREAARLMRERATAATYGPWEVVEDAHRGYADPAHEIGIWSDTAGRYVTEDVSMVEGNLNQWRANAAHIASWHPVVALAVADWLEQTADTHDDPCYRENYDDLIHPALAVALAYLNEVPS